MQVYNYIPYRLDCISGRIPIVSYTVIMKSEKARAKLPGYVQNFAIPRNTISDEKCTSL